MKIGIDLRPLQNGHKFRGIGEVIKQTTSRNLQLAVNEKHISFLFFEQEGDDPKELLEIPQGLRYEVVKLNFKPTRNSSLTDTNDFITMGYINDSLKHKLIKEALAFVYSTLYEGFGLPVLEYMMLKCPIITHHNSSLRK